jgi:hypothetical protein
MAKKGDKIIKDNYKKKHGKEKNFLSSMLFDKDIVLTLLNEKGCEGLRVYNALDDEGKEHFILVGTDAKGNNLLPDSDDDTPLSMSRTASDNGAMLLDNGMPCPPFCPDDNL